jgi:Domain of unknown function (DUF3425)
MSKRDSAAGGHRAQIEAREVPYATAPPKQSASEKRKAQNRAAQRTYRLKRNARIRELESLAASAGLFGDSTVTRADGSEDSSEQSISIEPHIQLAGATSEVLAYSSEDSLAQNNTLSPWQDVFDLSIEPLWTSPSEISSMIDFQPPSISASRNSSKGDEPSMTTNWESTVPSTILAPESGFSGSLIQVAEAYYPDPYANNIRLHITTMFMALEHNSAVIGISDVEETCHDDSISPFFKPQIAKTSGQSQVLDFIQREYRDIKRDLKPNVDQVTKSHHPVIDLLPFPDMRSRLIELTACDPPLIDEDEFWDDCHNEGLVCWGSIAPSNGIAPAGGGAPWDSRSWEGKRWFLTKWSFVVGGDDGDLGRSSEWWRAMRGVGQGFSL